MQAQQLANFATLRRIAASSRESVEAGNRLGMRC